MTAESRLRAATGRISHVSEAAKVARMNWWTVEYGLVGSLDESQAATLTAESPPPSGSGRGPSLERRLPLLMAGLLALFFVSAFRKPDVVPGRLQMLGEMGVTFVRSQIIDEVIGKQGRRFLPYLVTLFFMVFVLNIAGVLPTLNMAGTAVLMATHDLELVRRTDYRTIEMDHGRIVYDAGDTALRPAAARIGELT